MQSIRKNNSANIVYQQVTIAAQHRLQLGITCDILCLIIATPCCQVSKTTPRGSARYYPVLVSLQENLNQISDPIPANSYPPLWQIGMVKLGLQCGRRRLNRNITSYSLLRGSNRKPTSPARLCTPRLLLLAAENEGRKAKTLMRGHLSL